MRICPLSDKAVSPTNRMQIQFYAYDIGPIDRFEVLVSGIVRGLIYFYFPSFPLDAP